LTTGGTGNTEVTASNKAHRGKPRLRRMLANGDAACLVFADLPGEGVLSANCRHEFFDAMPN